MTQPSSPSSLAALHAGEWLDESKDFTDADAKKRHTLLRKARSVMMECMTALEPPRAGESRRARVEESPMEMGDLNLHRAPIFEASTQESGWQMGMLSAIATASRMGASNFEIRTQAVDTPKKRGYEDDYALHRNPYFDMMGLSQGGSGQLWKITIYAVTVK